MKELCFLFVSVIVKRNGIFLINLNNSERHLQNNKRISRFEEEFEEA